MLRFVRFPFPLPLHRHSYWRMDRVLQLKWHAVHGVCRAEARDPTIESKNKTAARSLSSSSIMYVDTRRSSVRQEIVTKIRSRHGAACVNRISNGHPFRTIESFPPARSRNDKFLLLKVFPGGNNLATICLYPWARWSRAVLGYNIFIFRRHYHSTFSGSEIPNVYYMP